MYLTTMTLTGFYPVCYYLLLVFQHPSTERDDVPALPTNLRFKLCEVNLVPIRQPQGNKEQYHSRYYYRHDTSWNYIVIHKIIDYSDINQTINLRSEYVRMSSQQQDI